MNSGVRRAHDAGSSPNGIHTVEAPTFTKPYRPDGTGIARCGQRRQLALIGPGQLDIRRGGERDDVRSPGGCTDVTPRLGAVWPQWQREELRTNLWLVPAVLILCALGLFGLTLRLDRAAYYGRFRPPSWVISGSADAARQILTSIAASVITVVGIVFSITIVTLTLASTQFGPRMLRNFIRDRGTQLTLGTFVATFVYCVVVLVSIGPGDRGEFVPHISITTAFGLVLIDLAVLIYFIHHIATQIQLPQVIASIAKDLAQAVAVQSADQPRFATRNAAQGPSLDSCSPGSKPPAASFARPKAATCNLFATGR